MQLYALLRGMSGVQIRPKIVYALRIPPKPLGGLGAWAQRGLQVDQCQRLERDLHIEVASVQQHLYLEAWGFGWPKES